MTDSPIPAEERQLDLLLALRHSEAGLTAADVLARVEGYDADGGASARRMFERDKAVLRELGIAITTTGQGEGSRYRVRDEDYALPEVRLTAHEAAALDLAASAWAGSALTASARRALTKIRAVSDEPSPGDGGSDDDGAEGPGGAVLPEVALDLPDRAVPPALAEAVAERRRVVFDYDSPSSVTLRARTVEPHRIRLSEGAWYLDGVDAALGETRTFRLARIRGGVEPVGEAGAFEVPADDDRRGPQRAVLALAPGRGLALRARAAVDDGSQPPLASAGAHAIPQGWERVVVPYEDGLSFAGTVAALGDGAVVLAPELLRERVIAHLSGAARLGDGPAATAEQES